MSAALFDPDSIVREVRAAANLAPPATTATLRQDSANCRNVAGVARRDALADVCECRNVAIVATPRAYDDADSEAAIEERAGLAADRVPALFLDAWARLNCQKPFGVSDAQWRRALDDGGLFIDSWGDDAAALGWTPGDLFDLTAGLVWRLAGVQVEALTPDQARLAGGRTLQRGKESMMAVRRLGDGRD